MMVLTRGRDGPGDEADHSRHHSLAQCPFANGGLTLTRAQGAPADLIHTVASHRVRPRPPRPATPRAPRNRASSVGSISNGVALG
jgi:hypothetical protein